MDKLKDRERKILNYMKEEIKLAPFRVRLCEAMEDKNMKPAEVAHAAGISKSSMTYYMQGKMVAKGINLVNLANALDVSEGWLMGMDVNKTRERPHAKLGVMSDARAALIDVCMEAPEEQVSMLYRLVAAALNVKV